MRSTKILLPLTSNLDIDTLLYAEGIARSKQAKLIVLYITSPLTFSGCTPYPSLLYSVSNISLDTIESANMAIKAKISSVLTQCEFEVLCLIGPAVDSIVSTSRDYGVDSIILPEDNSLLHKITGVSSHTKIGRKLDIPIIPYKKQA